MKLEGRKTVRRPRTVEMIQGPETEEQFNAARIIIRVIEVANEHLGGVENLKLSRESTLLVSITHPELVDALFPNQAKAIQQLLRSMGALENPEDLLMEEFVAKYIDKDDSKKLTPQEVRSVEDKILKTFKSTVTSGESPTRYLLRAALLACLHPESRAELASVIAPLETEVLDKVDVGHLDPNYNATASGGLLRLLHPSSAGSLQELTERHRAAWEEELRDSMSPKTVGSYSARGLQFYLDHALKMSAGLEIMLAKEAQILDTGEVVITLNKPLQQAKPTLPDRNLAA